MPVLQPKVICRRWNEYRQVNHYGERHTTSPRKAVSWNLPKWSSSQVGEISCQSSSKEIYNPEGLTCFQHVPWKWVTGCIRRFLLETITSRPPVGMAAVEGRCLGNVYVRSPRVAVHTFGLGHSGEVELRDVKGCKGSYSPFISGKWNMRQFNCGIYFLDLFR